MPRLAPSNLRSLLLASSLLAGCTSRTSTPDPLEDLSHAQCEQRLRCGCAGNVTADTDCDAYARTHARELREDGEAMGAHLVDLDCLEIIREAAQTVCLDDGIPYSPEAAALAVAVRACETTLLHGERRVGEPCEHPSAAIDARHGDCEIGAVCRDDGEGPRCVALTNPSPGYCVDADLRLGCPADQACVPIDADTSECRSFTAIGDACVGYLGDYCEGPPGQWCDPATSTCQARPGPGEPCLAPPPAGQHRCADGMFCDLGCRADAECIADRCERLPLAGEPCSSAGSCALGLECDGGTCVGAQACSYP